MKRNDVRTNMTKRSRVWLSVTLGLLLLILVTVPAVAKYLLIRNTPQNILDTKMFYFTSDLLTKNLPTEPLKISTGTSSMTFELRNFADELRNAEMNINYTVTVTSQDEQGART